VVLLHREHRRVHDLVSLLSFLFLRRWQHLVRDLLPRVRIRSIVILGVAELARSAPRAGLVDGPIPPFRVHGEGGVLMQTRQKDGPPAPDFVTPHPPVARHRRDRHPPGIEVPPTGKMDVA
jgi:hypothetical protein